MKTPTQMGEHSGKSKELSLKQKGGITQFYFLYLKILKLCLDGQDKNVLTYVLYKVC